MHGLDLLLPAAAAAVAVAAVAAAVAAGHSEKCWQRGVASMLPCTVI
jgi:hypothetical protein